MNDDILSDEDKALFRSHMRDVKPLHNENKQISHAPASQPRYVKEKPPVVDKKPERYFLSDFISEPVASQAILAYCHPSLSVKQFNALKKGNIRWEAKLDLHGLTTEQARTHLVSFIQQQLNKQTRCLLLIHGQGGHQGKPPVIKNLINRWLPQFPEVQAFHSALPKDGSFGAVYVLLRLR